MTEQLLNFRFRFWRHYYNAHRRFVMVPRSTLQRIGRAYRYLMDTMDADDAERIIYDCHPVAGRYPLVTFSEESVMTTLLDQYEDRPEFEDLVHDACQRVWHKWEGDADGSIAGSVEDWALDLVEEYAAERGIVLQPQE